MPRRLVSSRSPVVALEAVARDLAGEDVVILQAGPHRLHFVDGEGDGARGGDRRAENAQDHPDDAERRGRPERPAAVACRDPRDAQQRQHGQDEQGDDQHDRDDRDEVRARRADRVAQRLDADPHVAQVVDGAERPVERGEEPDVEHLHEHEHAQQRAHDDGEHAASGDGQQHRQYDDNEELERESRERAGGEPARLVRCDAATQTSATARPVSTAATRVRPRSVAGTWAAAPQPPGALADRRREQGERDDEERLRDGAGQDPGGRDRQDDPLSRRDNLAPAARRQRRAHPRDQPLAGSEQVAGGPDREHPRAVLGRDVDAEGADQERVDLAVESRAQRGCRSGAPCHPSVDRVQRQR